ncbi:MAG: DUF3108 domain-containing protein [Blastocatellia bacterium]|nr:DUF3108 domain-containing protein [Blastocatellia bacterium]
MRLNMRLLLLSLLLAISPTFFPHTGFTQEVGTEETKAAVATSDPVIPLPPEEKFLLVKDKVKSDLPFKKGEYLNYELKFTKFLITGTIGEITFNVEDEPVEIASVEELNSFRKIGNWKFRIDAKSKGFLTVFFGTKVNDVFMSLVDPDEFNVIKTEKILEEGKSRSKIITEFSKEDKKVKNVITDLAKPKNPPAVKERKSLAWVTDVISSWYAMRAQDLSQNKRLFFPVSENGDVYEVEVEQLGKEDIETELGKFSTLKLDMKIFDGRLVRKSGKLYLWVTDDHRKIPVKGQIKMSAGTVNIALTEMKNTKDRSEMRQPVVTANSQLVTADKE